MGFGWHLRDALVGKLAHAYSVDVTKTHPEARFATQLDRNTAYKVLKANKAFNPKKVGKYLLRFYVVKR